MDDLKRCPLCGGEIDDHSRIIFYGWKIVIENSKCKRCGISARYELNPMQNQKNSVKLKSDFEVNPYREAIDNWNRGSFDGR